MINNFDLLLKIWIGFGVLTFAYLIISKIRTPYGRHSSNQWGVMVNNKWAWFWMEFPALVVMPISSIIGMTTNAGNSIQNQAHLLLTINPH
jgi:steroid 5-alpha-reductase/3-oxo-5-alpha-steroid 4-dehydrogenase 1